MPDTATAPHPPAPRTWRQWLREWYPLILGCAAALVFVLLFIPPSPLYQPRMVKDLSEAQRARDDAAKVRARQFVEDLGFPAGGVACRAVRSGSAWCTVRVEGTDKTFALFCPWKHPTCIENRADIDPN